MRTLCLDFDGVVHSYDSGWKGARVIPDGTVPGALSFMLLALRHGWDVCIYSSRSGYFGGRRAMRKWLREAAGELWHETPLGPGLEDVSFPLFKPAATVTLDDRAITFNGTWPSLDSLGKFKPWNKRS